MAVFRVERTRDYTVMCNHHLKDSNLSLKAKGLLSMMLSLPDEWNYTTRGLAAICKEGVDAIGKTLKELEQAGYIIRRRLRGKDGRISDTEYTIFEKPRKRKNSAPDTTSPDTENPYMVNPDMEESDAEKPDTDNPAQLNTKKSNTQKTITDLSNTHSFFPSAAPAADGLTDGFDKRAEIKEQIEYDCICQQHDRMQLDELVEIMDQVNAIKTVKRKITDLDKSKIEEQKKAVRSGYDMDIIPSDLATYGAEAKKLLQDLQSRNERMFLLTFLIMNTADTPRQLDNNIFQTSSIAQKYNCALTRLDFQQEEGLMSSLPLGMNQIEIQRGLTTSSVAIFVPFTTQELFQTGTEALYYGINALSNNLIMVDRKLLKNPNGLILGTPGCFAGETRVRLANGETATFADLVENGITEAWVKAYDEEVGKTVDAFAREIRIEKYVHSMKQLHLADGTAVCCTDTHLIMDADGSYITAGEIAEGQKLSGNHTVTKVTTLTFPDAVPVYDMTVPQRLNFVLENGLIVHNSGKSFSAKREITNAFLICPKDDIIICDPEGEYTPLVERLSGQVIKLSPTGKGYDGLPCYINPMDLNLDYSDDDNPLSLKSDFILSLCELIVGGKDGLAPVEKTIIDRCVRIVYRDYLNDPKPENMPILEDLYNALRAQDEKEAQYIATALEIRSLYYSPLLQLI